MKESIYTIPVNEVFEPKDGCPICRLRDMLESRAVEYIMGAAMMEPDVRIETNEQGFCSRHFNQMLAQRNRLSVALILESHLNYIQKEIFEKKQGLFSAKDAKSSAVQKLSGSCYVCSKIEWGLNHMLETLFKLWSKEPAFRELYAQQPVICLEHYALLASQAPAKLGKKLAPEFLEVTGSLSKRYLDEVQADVSHFCKMFDYRNAGANADWGNSRDSIERAVWYLTSRTPEARK